MTQKEFFEENHANHKFTDFPKMIKHEKRITDQKAKISENSNNEFPRS